MTTSPVTSPRQSTEALSATLLQDSTSASASSVNALTVLGNTESPAPADLTDRDITALTQSNVEDPVEDFELMNGNPGVNIFKAQKEVDDLVADFELMNRFSLTAEQQAEFDKKFPNQSKLQNAGDAIGSAAAVVVQEGKDFMNPSITDTRSLVKESVKSLGLIAAAAGASLIAGPLALIPYGILGVRLYRQVTNQHAVQAQAQTAALDNYLRGVRLSFAPSREEN